MRRPLTIGVAAVLIVPVARAQDSTAVHVDSGRITLPAVSVTATRTPTQILNVPLAVTVVTKEQLRTVSGYGLNDALATVPGVVAQSRYGTSDVRLVIRGFGARGAGDRSNAGTSRGIRVLVDGFPETEPDGRTSFDLVDLAAAEGIEVIRSNASAVWGNAAGGVVSISSVPRFHDSFVSVQQMRGGFGLLRSIVRGGTKLGPSTLFGSFVNTSFAGWRQHSDSRRALIDVGFRGLVGDRTSLGVFALGANNLLHIPGPLTQAELDADPSQANTTYAARDERRYNRVGRLGASLTHTVSDATELSGMVYVNPKYLQRSERGTFRDFTRYHTGGSFLLKDTRALGRSARSTLLVGADEAYQDGAILFYSLSPEGGRGTELRDNKGEGANNFGVFVQEQLGLGEHLEINLGARYDDIHYNYRSYISPALDARKSFRRITPKLGLLVRSSPFQSFYANVGGGIEAPAGNETDPASTFGQDTVTALNPLLDPIRSTTYELGTKRFVSLAPGRALEVLEYDLALYYTDVRNEIVPYRGGRFYFTAGKVRRLGGELGATIRAAGGLSLQGALTVSDNRYVRYLVDSVHYGVPGQFADYSDNSVVGVPDVFYGALLGYTPPFFKRLLAQVGVQSSGSYFADDANAVRVPGYTLLNATLALREPWPLRGGVGIGGFVRLENATDRRYVGSAFLNPDVVGGVPVAFEPGLPRTVLVSLSLEHSR
jgi:iron complex outermembrane receptor protein